MPPDWSRLRLSFAVWLVEYAIFSIITLTYALFVKITKRCVDAVFKRNYDMPIVVVVLSCLQIIAMLFGILTIIRRKIANFGAMFAVLTLFALTYVICIILASVAVIRDSPKFTNAMIFDSLRDAAHYIYPERKFWFNFQSTKHCCGAKHYNDWMEFQEEYSRENSSIMNSCCTDKLLTKIENVYEDHKACENRRHRRYLYHRPCGPFILDIANESSRISFTWFIAGATFMFIFTTMGMYISYRSGIHLVGDQMVFTPFSSEAAIKHLLHEMLNNNN